MKHSYLILAHNEPLLLEHLVACLDDERNDIYIHWDAKSGDVPHLETKKSRLCILEDRMDVRWADFSMVEAEYMLMEKARSLGPYAYYHLISGVDMPLMTQDYIHSCCDMHQGAEFVGFSEPKPGELEWRTSHRFIFTGDFRHSSRLKAVLRAGFNKLQDILGYRRNRDVEMKKGPQWFSITGDFVDYLLDRKAWVREHFRHTFTPDELFVPTLLWNSSFRGRAFNPDDEFDGCRRFIKWVDGNLLPIGKEDIGNTGDKWFARKFSSDNMEIVKMVEDSINGK